MPSCAGADLVGCASKSENRTTERSNPFMEVPKLILDSFIMRNECLRCLRGAQDETLLDEKLIACHDLVLDTRRAI